MYNNQILFSIIVAALLALFLSLSVLITSTDTGNDSLRAAASSTSVENNSIIDIDDIQLIDNVIKISNASKMKFKLTLTYLNSSCVKEYSGGDISIDVDSLIRCDIANRNHIALHLVKNNMRLPFTITISEISKEYEYIYKPKHINNDTYATLISGKAAALHSQGKVDVKIEDLTKWLYFNDNYMATEDVQSFFNVVYDLSQFESSVYHIDRDASLPVLKNFKGLKYRIKSNIKADYYYLFATLLRMY